MMTKYEDYDERQSADTNAWMKKLGIAVPGVNKEAYDAMVGRRTT